MNSLSAKVWALRILLVAAIVLLCVLAMAAGQWSMATWITVFNVALNAYPVMLQRANRWRMQQARASTHEPLTGAT